MIQTNRRFRGVCVDKGWHSQNKKQTKEHPTYNYLGTTDHQQ